MPPILPGPLPSVLVENAVEVWGDDGRRWLKRLPGLLAEIAREWRLEIEAARYGLSYHWVAPVRREDGTKAVLKLGPPEPGHLGIEAAALEIYGGEGAVRLLEHDPGRGALLLERAEPGRVLSELVPDKDEEATAVFLDVARRLRHVPPPGCALPGLEKESASFSGHLRRFPGDGPLPRHLVERAGRLFDELCASAPERLVLHGDLHHDNILSAEREPWLAIDPHGVVGDPGYEAGVLFYNPGPDDRDGRLVDLVPARIEQVADGLAMPVERVVAWGFVMAVLSEVWTAQGDGTPGSRALDVALSLVGRLP
ncbi:aminoglycoside phosphotransferase family protein [Actinomadura litoris]|uniref:Phosphotransferase n=1 Tax=Actinomadura litoris TaxID=2678616 RepID=A0A7K1KVM2_9ACTN|nr:aminoglycoside phosphotransferase family protein [Actinomadura litoris]MUN36238.1 phosphotransferase [Actinomadura litoris]